jgi:hypothetical protein
MAAHKRAYYRTNAGTSEQPALIRPDQPTDAIKFFKEVACHIQRAAAAIARIEQQSE